MRTRMKWNGGWLFYKGTADIAGLADGETVNLPHSWNATDGQDGGNDYFRGSCVYTKKISKADLPANNEYYLEIRGANSSADAYVNGKHMAHHDGGYSTWRINFTNELQEENEIAIVVDNAPNDKVYPQVADFTFYGGLYRDVYLVCVPQTHFDLDYFGGEGFTVTPVMDGKNANVNLAVYTKDMQDGDEIVYTVCDKEGSVVYENKTSETKVDFVIENANLWNGRKNPYLYTAKAAIVRGGETLDEVSARFGCRSFEIDPERGFILNGEEYPLRGVSRHQDRWGIGNALLPEHHEEDINLILEVGATTIRLAHYQHDQYFYDLCDEKGLVIWAEIPYISQHMPTARENTISQMKELIVTMCNLIV